MCNAKQYCVAAVLGGEDAMLLATLFWLWQLAQYRPTASAGFVVWLMIDEEVIVDIVEHGGR